jgi:hypothetical protein
VHFSTIKVGSSTCSLIRRRNRADVVHRYANDATFAIIVLDHRRSTLDCIRRRCAIEGLVRSCKTEN